MEDWEQQWLEHITSGQVYDEQWWQDEVRVVVDNMTANAWSSIGLELARVGATLQWRANEWVI